MAGVCALKFNFVRSFSYIRCFKWFFWVCTCICSFCCSPFLKNYYSIRICHNFCNWCLVHIIRRKQHSSVDFNDHVKIFIQSCIWGNGNSRQHWLLYKRSNRLKNKHWSNKNGMIMYVKCNKKWRICIFANLFRTSSIIY